MDRDYFYDVDQLLVSDIKRKACNAQQPTGTKEMLAVH
jgi:hypothetical protein